MALKIILKPKCPICRGVMKYKAFIGSGNVQGFECVSCVLIVGNSAFLKLDEAMFFGRLRKKHQQELRNKCQPESL